MNGRWLAAAFAVAFGVATVVEGGRVLFGGADAGAVVPFVLIFNFGAGFAYVLAGVAIAAGRRSSLWLARALAAATLLVFAAFGLHVLRGGAYEPRTVFAMALRSLFWAAQALLLPRLLGEQGDAVGGRLQRALGLVRRSLKLVVVAAALALVAWVKLWRPVAVEVARVDRGTVLDEAFGRGTVESQREAAVGFDMVGRLSAVLVDEGARVTLGQELAQLETDQAQADLRSAQTGVAAARATLQRLAAEEARARAVLDAAQRDAARADGLVAAGALPAQQGDDASDRLRLARADLDRVLAQRGEATHGIEVASGGAEQRRVAMVRATLLAPFDGVVTRRLREPGDTVTIGSTVLRIVDTDQVYVNAALDETVLARLAIDQTGTILWPGAGAAIAGRVTRVGWEADRQTHEVLVEVTPDRLDRRVAIGQRADVRIELARREQVLRVPTRMLQRDAIGAYVYVDRDGRVALVRPRLGLVGDDEAEVLDGLAEGDLVLAAPGGGSLPVGRRWEAP